MQSPRQAELAADRGHLCAHESGPDDQAPVTAPEHSGRHWPRPKVRGDSRLAALAEQVGQLRLDVEMVALRACRHDLVRTADEV